MLVVFTEKNMMMYFQSIYLLLFCTFVDHNVWMVLACETYRAPERAVAQQLLRDTINGKTRTDLAVL